MELLNVGINARTPEPGSATKKQHRPVADRQAPAYPMNFPAAAVEKNLNYGNYTKIPATITVDGSKPVAEVGDKDAKQEFYPFKPVEPVATQTLVSGKVVEISPVVSNGTIAITLKVDIPNVKLVIGVLDPFNEKVGETAVQANGVQATASFNLPSIKGNYTITVKFESQTAPYTWQVQV